MLSRDEWFKLRPKIKEELEQTNRPLGRWGHGKLRAFAQQLLDDNVELRAQLSEKGWEHPDDVLERVRRAVWRVESAASDFEDAAQEIRDAVEDVEAVKPQRATSFPGQEPSSFVGLDELLNIIWSYHLEKHEGAFRWCTNEICIIAKYTK